MADELATIHTAPARIWLQVDTYDEDYSEPFPSDSDGVSWCAEQIGGTEVEYVRADIADTLRAELAAAKAEIARLQTAVDRWNRTSIPRGG